MGDSLNETMQFEHVVRVDPGGKVTKNTGMHGPEDAYVYTEGAEPELDQRPGDGWSMLHGWTGQYGYNGPVMHNSEFIGGALEEHIRENPGYYVALTVSHVGLGETDCAECGAESGEWCTDDCEGDRETLIEGWVVAFRELEPELSCLRCGRPERKHICSVAPELRDHLSAAQFYGTCPGDVGVMHRLYPEAFPTPGPYAFKDCGSAKASGKPVECWHVADVNGTTVNTKTYLYSEYTAREWAADRSKSEH